MIGYILLGRIHWDLFQNHYIDHKHQTLRYLHIHLHSQTQKIHHTRLHNPLSHHHRIHLHSQAQQNHRIHLRNLQLQILHIHLHSPQHKHMNHHLQLHLDYNYMHLHLYIQMLIHSNLQLIHLMLDLMDLIKPTHQYRLNQENHQKLPEQAYHSLQG